VTFEDDRPPAPLTEFVALERALAERGWAIPPSYKAFLARHDGGRPSGPRVFRFHQGDGESDSSVAHFLGVRPSPDGDLLLQIKSIGGALPKGVLPIATDSNGNVICIDARDGRDGPVVFWDHEEIPDQPDDSNLYEIAPTFEAFLEGLEDYEPLPEPEPKQPSAWRRLFGRR
jgi:cell wall assembly regulator SMI1